jgi:hypothetical protein
MIPAIRRWLVSALLTGVALAPAAGFAQTVEDRKGEPGGSPPVLLPPPTPVQERPPAYVLPPVGPPTVDFPRPDPLLDRPYAEPPGFYADVEANVLWLHLRNQLGGPVQNTITNTQDIVSFAGNRLDPALSPQFTFGYRLPDGWGGLQFDYRFLASRGRQQTVTGSEDVIQAPADQVGRVDFNIIDFAYVSREFSLEPHWNMRWGIGARMMFLFFDSRLRFLDPASAPGTILAQTESNHLRAYGAWTFLDVERKTPVAGLCAFGRLEATDMYARTSQNYTERVAGNAGDLPATFQARYDGAVSIPTLRGVLGLSYTAPSWNHSRFLLGYEYETFFQIGRQTPTPGPLDTRGQLDAHGLFLRAEFSF